MRFQLTLEYDGTGFSGWQSQASGDAIQDCIEGVLGRLFGEKIRLSAAGRTDAGVHALGQVAAFDAPARFSAAELQRALNALLPAKIVASQVCEVGRDFDPRRHACLRVYEYRIVNRELRSPFEWRYVWQVREPLDCEAMAGAARVFLGEHDFAAFRSLGSEVGSTRRAISLSQWHCEGDHLRYRVEGSSFMRHMVRTMVAAMVEVGLHRLQKTAIGELLACGQRSAAPAAAPARGLYLVEVRYPLNAPWRL